MILSDYEKEEVAERVDQFLSDLNLSEADKPAFQMVMRDFFVGMVALGATDFSPKTDQKIARALIKGRESRMKELLSKEQYKTYKAKVKELRTDAKELMKLQQG